MTVGEAVSDGRTSSSTGEAARALSLAAALCGVRVESVELLHRFGAGGDFGMAAMLRAAGAYGLKARHLRPKPERLHRYSLPAIAAVDGGEHFLVVAKVTRSAAGKVENILVQRPGGRPEALSAEQFFARWTGSLVLVARKTVAQDVNRPFGLSWFVGSVLRYRRILFEVLAASFAIQLIGLVTPLFFQVVVDKVLVHRGTSTLDVVAIGLGLAMTFDVTLSGLRSYIFSHTANRVDVELGAHLFSRLLRLPLAYFGARRVGDSVARVRELENIRQFITGSTLTLFLDLLFATIFLAVIYIYSVPLGMIVTGAIPLYGIVSAVATPALRLRIEEKFRRGAENQAFLVETVTGIETIKSMAVEPLMQRRWEDQLAGYVKSGFRVSSLGVIASQFVQFFSKITTLLILYVGAKLVMTDHLTVGGLVAVNMLSGQIAAPVLRLAQLWQDFQQVKISVDRVGDIMNTIPEPERAPNAAARPALTGGIVLEDVRFRYRPDAPPALDGVSLAIPPGQVVGIVGPSGSGKSTITKLIQRLHLPESGRVTADGLDLAMLDPMWLRRQVGVVLQESILFNGTIRENIALVDPGLPMDRIVAAAALAGAHEFISAMPGGYDAPVGERGATLSGGQRQRIAIARALITQPRILIFDEATSALDLDSEQAIQANMAAICRGRTVIIVAHRLSAVRFAHRIVTVEQGRVVEDGAPRDLLRNGGRFARLFESQGVGFGDAAGVSASAS